MAFQRATLQKWICSVFVVLKFNGLITENMYEKTPWGLIINNKKVEKLF